MHRFGEFQRISGAVVYPEIPVAPRLAENILADCGPAVAQLGMQFVQFICENVNADGYAGVHMILKQMNGNPVALHDCIIPRSQFHRQRKPKFLAIVVDCGF